MIYIGKTSEELTKVFIDNLLVTNRGYNYYVKWANVIGYEKYLIEIHAMDILIGCKDDSLFRQRFDELLHKLPNTILLFPFLFGLAKAERTKLNGGKYKLTVIQDEIDSADNFSYAFPSKVTTLTDNDIQVYYDFFVQMGLKSVFQDFIEKSTLDYIVGVLVGVDSNGRKNRGGSAFELACQPIFEKETKKHNLLLLTQKKFQVLEKYGIVVSEDIANRKADFIVVDTQRKKVMNFEVNFYNGTGSKPEEIIDSYINRQNELERLGFHFSLVTDGKGCWTNASHQLNKGFRYMKYLQNFYMLKHGMLDEILTEVFG